MTGTDLFDVTLERDPRAAAQARRLITASGGTWPSSLVDTAKLLISELVGNAVRHGHGEISLRAQLTNRGSLRVEVSDGNPTAPRVVDPPPTAEQDSGRGMLIVQALADSWGTRSNIGSSGKTVWFQLDPSSDGRALIS